LSIVQDLVRMFDSSLEDPGALRRLVAEVEASAVPIADS
jgi:hypothetical protein